MKIASRRVDHYEVFEEAAVRYLPGFLYSLNFADTKRRNNHLGYQVVDREIEEFEILLRRSISEGSFVKRVAGNKWLMISRTKKTEEVESVLHEFAQSKEIEVGWSVQAEQNGINKRWKNVVSAEIFRAVRFVDSAVGPEILRRLILLKIFFRPAILLPYENHFILWE